MFESIIKIWVSIVLFLPFGYFILDEEHRKKITNFKTFCKYTIIGDLKIIRLLSTFIYKIVVIISQFFFDKIEKTGQRKEKISTALDLKYNFEVAVRKTDWLKEIVERLDYDASRDAFRIVFKKFQTAEEFEKFFDWFCQFRNLTLCAHIYIATDPSSPTLLVGGGEFYYSFFELQTIQSYEMAQRLDAQLKENQLKEVDVVTSEID